ncbi:cell envelope integrity protein TolA [Massilia sp. PAMC28688]|uniref:cell envelope integrity protein TolA n=1 Tax=Massilia sp. PAMC28688 TaxID=2861283 RepID=UPI001C626849|nr:cell envelope integrity protein TolA [Massilia sp. PAMC28688]QYF93896.1 cell envelope integrity protein TolA [Massilia sp. PAMC28688]
MHPAPTPGSPYQVPPEPSAVSSTVMAVLVHAALLGFLWVGIRWQNVEPVAVTAEVWDMKVQDAAPREITPEPVPVPTPAPIPKPVAPPPPPPPNAEEPVAPKPPDIALEREKKEKKLREQKLAEKKIADEKLARQKELADQKARELAEQKEKEKEKEKELAKEKAKAERLAKLAKEAAEAKLAEKLRAAQMKRMLGGLAGAGDADKTTAPRVDTGYVTAVRNKIKRSTSFNGDTDVDGNPSATFKIEQLPTGEIISVRKSKSSGIAAFDDAVERGINNSSPLPKKKDGTVERTIEVTIRMKEVD